MALLKEKILELESHSIFLHTRIQVNWTFRSYMHNSEVFIQNCGRMGKLFYKSKNCYFLRENLDLKFFLKNIQKYVIKIIDTENGIIERNSNSN